MACLGTAEVLVSMKKYGSWLWTEQWKGDGMLEQQESIHLDCILFPFRSWRSRN